MKRSAEHGFTLVELMVVIAIIGLASAAVVWALPDPRGRLADEAARFAARAEAARDLAIVGARPISLWVGADGYGFDERAGGQWRAMADKPFRIERWGRDTRALVGSGRERVTYDSVGLPDRPARITIARDGASASVLIAGDGSATVAR